ncbi:Kazal-type serine protease inhibitor family protein [Nitrosopumilus sp. S4]
MSFVSLNFLMVDAQEWTDSNIHDPGVASKAIPDWIDNSFRWYADGLISQQELLTSFNWMLDNNFMHLSDKAAKEVNDLRTENVKLREQLSGLGHEMGRSLGTPDSKTNHDEIMVLLRPAPGVYTLHDEIMVLFRPAPGYEISFDDEVVIFLKSESKKGYDYYRGAANTGNEHGEFWFEGLKPGTYDGEFWFEELIPGHSQNNQQQDCSIQCLVYDPVCGVDGITYGCGFEDAACHGVDVDYAGECKIDSQACPKNYSPVCGVDGNTYSNACYAKAENVDVDYAGECKIDSQACPKNYSPVCGVDGNTYSNTCYAKAANVDVDYGGECKNTCESNDQCDNELVCRDGMCQPACSIQCLVYDPVCGIDGITYGCGFEDAACHGVDVDYAGECRDTSTRAGQ